MALGGILATALTTHASRSKGLFIAGVDVIEQPGSTAGNLYGVPIGSVTITEVGPGGVSGMDFVIEDPLLAISLTYGADVRFQDFTRDVTLFLGWIQGWSIVPEGIGRIYRVQAIGVEAQLDWSVLQGDFTFSVGAAAFQDTAALVQAICAACIGTSGIRALSSGTTTSTQAGPITKDATFYAAGPITLTAGTTLRDAINSALGVCMAQAYPVTIDFTYGLRVYPDGSGASLPSDYVGIVGTDVYAGPAGAPEYEVNASEMPAGVVFKGTGVTVVVPGGVIAVGPWVVITDTTITTTADATNAALNYIAQFNVGLRGTWARDDITPYTGAYAGGTVAITDTQMGLTGVAMRLSQITKTFNPSGRENWVMSFGGTPPSGTAMLRRLTRGTLS